MKEIIFYSINQFENCYAATFHKSHANCWANKKQNDHRTMIECFAHETSVNIPVSKTVRFTNKIAITNSTT